MNARYCYYGLVAVVTVAFGLMYLLMPRAGDDYWFLEGMLDDGFCECWRWHICNDNSRRCNILGSLT